MTTGRLTPYITAAAFMLTACGGGSAVVSPPPTGNSGPVTFSDTPGNVCCLSAFTISVQPDGAATMNTNGSPPVTKQLTSALTQQIFSDVRQAWPLSSLTAYPPVPDSGGITVAWAGQTSPNIVAAPGGIEAFLNSDSSNLNRAFGL